MQRLFTLLFLSFCLIGGSALQAGQAPAPVDPQSQMAPQDLKAQLKAARKAAKAERKNMSPEEKQALKAQTKQFRRELREARRQNGEVDFLLIVIVTILLPPLGVFLYEGDITTNFWITLLLTLLFVLPGLIFGLLVVLDVI
jgi:uncharacterized membrane protein YqaE (UPF0057 family)